MTKIHFEAKISDFGLSTIIDGSTAQLSICGTPLYSSPQLLKKKGYSNKVDTWALGVMLYELLMGVTPFHSFEMKELMQKINEGRYSVTLPEPLTVECALFLTQCLQANENDRIDMDELMSHPFINFDEPRDMTILDAAAFKHDMREIFGDSVNTSRVTAAEQYVKGSFKANNPNKAVYFTTKETEQWNHLKKQFNRSTAANTNTPD